ncbi:hypothetical protein D3C81_1636150 [compost metagenome]
MDDDTSVKSTGLKLLGDLPVTGCTGRTWRLDEQHPTGWRQPKEVTDLEFELYPIRQSLLAPGNDACPDTRPRIFNVGQTEKYRL